MPGRRRRPRGGPGPTTRICTEWGAGGTRRGRAISFSIFRFRFSGRTVTRIHSHTSKPHRATADSGLWSLRRLGFRSGSARRRDPTAHRASGRYQARARADTHGGRPDPGARSRACQRNRANGTCATSGPCQAPRHQAPTCLRKLLQRVYMYTEYRPSRQAEPADEGPAHGTQGDGRKLRARKLHA